MASSAKTPNLKLNLWEGTDKPEREDFNRDNTHLDQMAGDIAKPPEIRGGTWWLYDFTAEEYVDSGVSANGVPGPANNLAIGTVQGGATAGATITGTAPSQTLNLTLPKGDKGDAGAKGETGEAGRSIVSIARTSGTGAPGTVDTYTITYSDATTSTFSVTNGADGSGAGDMLKSIYDTNDNGIVDDAEKLGGNLPAYFAVAEDVVPNARTVNEKPLDDDIVLTAVDVGAAPTTHTHTTSQITNFPATMPPTAHNHAAGDINSGMLPIARGGTGGTTAAAARTSLGITPANIGAIPVGKITMGTAEPTGGSDGDIYFRYEE